MKLFAIAVLLTACGASQHVLTDSEYFACNEEGLRVINDSDTCQAAVDGLNKLITDKPECQAVFETKRYSNRCTKDGGSDVRN